MDPNQISYESVCTITGRLFLESRHEMEKLTEMLMEIQKKLSVEQQERLKAEANLAEAKQRISFLEGQLKSNA